MINRATFYYHFQDIYDLSEKVLSEVLFINLDVELYKNSELDEDVLISIFNAITNFQQSLSNRCHRGYEDTIARIIKEQLGVIFLKMLQRQHATMGEDALRVSALMLSWGIYGASVEWSRNGNSITPEEYIKSALPFIKNGVNF